MLYPSPLCFLTRHLVADSIRDHWFAPCYRGATAPLRGAKTRAPRTPESAKTRAQFRRSEASKGTCTPSPFHIYDAAAQQRSTFFGSQASLRWAPVQETTAFVATVNVALPRAGTGTASERWGCASPPAFDRAPVSD